MVWCIEQETNGQVSQFECSKYCVYMPYRGGCSFEEVENGERERRVSYHFTPRNQHPLEIKSPKYH